MKNKKSSIAVSLSIRFTIILAFSIIILSVLFQFLQQQNMRARQSRDLLHSAQDVLLKMQETDVVKNIQMQTVDLPYFVTFVIYDSESEKIIATNDPFLPCLEKSEEKSVHKIIKNYFTDGDLNILYCTATGNINFQPESSDFSQKTMVTVQLSIDMTNDSASNMLQGLPRTILIMLIPITIISFLALLFITKRTMKPVTDITKAAESISSTNLDTLLPVSKKNNELDYLAQTFNSLFQRLKTDFDKEHAFTSNVSHELKTPVAVILGQANLLRRWGKNDPAQLEKSLATIIDEAHSMESVISNLLMITHMENGTYQFLKENVDVLQLFTKVKDEFATIAPEMKFEIAVQGTDFSQNFSDNRQLAASPLQIYTDRELLRQVLVVIISNSSRYAGKNCTIKMQADGKTLKISDNGPGFSAEVLPHIFDRFYRGDKSHNRKDGGSGLGLSIAKTIIEALGGKISASNVQNGGAEITINF